MAIDTLAFTKTLEAAGVDRNTAEAQAEAMAKHVLPELVTKSDLNIALERLEHRLEAALSRSTYEQTSRLVGLVFAVVGLLDAILFALLRFSH